MAGASKYNYNTALKLLQKGYNSNEKITFKQLETALGLEKPIKDKSASATNNSAIYLLRKKLKEQYGLTFRSVVTRGNDEPENFYYIVSQVEDNSTSKSIKTHRNNLTQEANNALQKDNQKLYIELEQANAANAAFQAQCIKLQEKEQEYKKIIESLYKLLYM